MALGVRGANPIWLLDDLSGNLFDSTFWMYVLENTLPYVPAPVYHYPDLTGPWTNPIQFLANGTLPVDIYFESDKVYRLEFRQNNGLQPPSQSDPLIYEVNNYVAGSGGSTPVDTLAFSSTNQVTNPQFSLINFVSPYTLSATNPDPIDIGPGWVLELAGTGTVTVYQVPLNDSNINPSNAPYALRMVLSGWNDGGVKLRQRFQQNGMLWANKVVSSTITTRIEGLPQQISAILVDSMGTTLGTVLALTGINGDWNQFTGHWPLPNTTNTDTPPSAYIDYQLLLPSNADIYVTSIQLVVQDLPVEPKFDQDSIDRQIDHTYHYAYPIVPIGTVIDYYGFGTPSNYLSCSGQSLSRITYNQLFNVLTNVETVILSLGFATFTVANGLIYAIGKPLEGVGIAPGTVISNIVGNVVTMSAVATGNGSTPVRFFSVGNDDGSTTFNAPTLNGVVLAGAYAGLFPSQGVGSSGGSATVTLLPTNLPPHVHAYTHPQGAGSGYQVSVTGVQDVTSQTGTGTAPDGITPLASTPFSVVQPTVLAHKVIRYK